MDHGKGSFERVTRKEPYNETPKNFPIIKNYTNGLKTNGIADNNKNDDILKQNKTMTKTMNKVYNRLKEFHKESKEQRDTISKIKLMLEKLQHSVDIIQNHQKQLMKNRSLSNSEISIISKSEFDDIQQQNDNEEKNDIPQKNTPKDESSQEQTEEENGDYTGVDPIINKYENLHMTSKTSTPTKKTSHKNKAHKSKKSKKSGKSKKETKKTSKKTPKKETPKKDDVEETVIFADSDDSEEEFD